MLAAITSLVIVPTALAVLSGQKITDDIYNFRMHLDKKISLLLGVPGMAFFGFCLYGSYIAGQLSPFLIVIFGGLFVLSIFITLLPVKGFYDNEVKNDKLYARRWFIIHKSIPISEIGHCTERYNDFGGSIRVYRKNGSCFCWIDLMQYNVDNFCERMQKERITIEGELPTA